MIDARVSKRALLHPSIAAPLAGAHIQKTIYLSTSTPFVASIKRVRTYLSAIDARAMGTIDLSASGNLTDRQLVGAMGEGRHKEGEEVVVKASGKAIERALNVGLYFSKQEDCRVRIRTGTAGAVDDVEVEGEEDSSRVRRVPVLEIGISLK